jgi:NTP pyrophosphatase (non-canonical NTP hydrolase)
MLAWRLGKTVEWRYPRFGIQYGPLAAFYRRMERKLLLNAGKGGWEDNSLESLLALLMREVSELTRSIRHEDGMIAPDDIADEAADVANHAMMIADVASQLRNPL